VMHGRTTFVIAHRLSTIRSATRILVFKDGRIIESGTYHQLAQRGGFFAELVQAQFGAVPRTAALTLSDEGRIVET
jgi:ABC-type multidrug transport system fused ATPase/permease subunit